MPARATAPTGAPCWVDLMTTDVERAREFYGELFGWTAGEADANFGGYFMFTRNGVTMAGGMPSMAGAVVPTVWSVYFAVQDAEKAVAAARERGGHVVSPAMAVGDAGSMAVLADPGGAVAGVWQAGDHQGFGIVAEAGAPSWFELHTRDYDAVLAFYRDVLGWQTQPVSESPEFRYSIAMRGEEQLAGVYDATAELAEGVPAHWLVYFGCDDADEAVARVSDLGGSVLEPAQDTPYGRIATVADPMGARFRLVAPNAAMPARE